MYYQTRVRRNPRNVNPEMLRLTARTRNGSASATVLITLDLRHDTSLMKQWRALPGLIVIDLPIHTVSDSPRVLVRAIVPPTTPISHLETPLRQVVYAHNVRMAPICALLLDLVRPDTRGQLT